MRRAFLLLPCAVLAACGSSGSQRLSRELYARRADGICSLYNRFEKTLGAPTGVQELVKAVDRSLPVFDRAVADLRALQPPEDERALSRRWLATLSRLRSDVVDLRGRAVGNDLTGMRRVARHAQQVNAESTRLATRLGMHVCNTG